MGRMTNCKKCGIKCQGVSGYCREHLNQIKSRKTREKLAAKKAYKKNKPKVLAKAIERGDILLPEATELIYENYKEPLRRVPEGYGYLGTVATNKDKTHVQCHICGKLFRSLAHHIIRTHGQPVEEYKQEFGLGVTTALIGEATREQRIKKMQHLAKPGELPDHLKEYNRKVQSGEIKHKRTRSAWTLEMQNKLGYCPDQTLEKITDLKEQLGRVPSNDEFKLHYGGRWMSSITYHFGSWNNAVKEAGMIPVGEQKKLDMSEERLIHYLQEFQKKYNRIPVTSDWKRGLLPPRYHYHKVFGTLNDARIAAGMNAIIALPRHQWMEVPADEWEAYRARVMTTSLKQRRKESNKKWYQRKKQTA